MVGLQGYTVAGEALPGGGLCELVCEVTAIAIGLGIGGHLGAFAGDFLGLLFCGPICDSGEECLGDPECRDRCLGGLAASGAFGAGGCIPTPAPGAQDPNEKTGPNGVGLERFVGANALLSYRTEFENIASARASAIIVRIADRPALSLDEASFRLGDLHFGDTTIEVPDNLSAFETTVDLTSEFGLLVDIKAGIDPVMRVASWDLRARDPTTGGLPADPFIGFLPPNDETGRGQGWAEYTIKPRAEVPTGTIIRNRATIVFDFNEPIDTNEVFNTIDADAPISAIDPLPSETSCPDIELSWSGADPPDGSGLGTFTVYVSKDGGTFVPVIQNTPDTLGTYTAEPGHAYAFYTRARDNAGNIEEVPAKPDAVIVVRTPGDLTGDSAINLPDAARLAPCLSGPGVQIGQGCNAADLDCNGYADLRDFAKFQRAFRPLP